MKVLDRREVFIDFSEERQERSSFGGGNKGGFGSRYVRYRRYVQYRRYARYVRQLAIF